MSIGEKGRCSVGSNQANDDRKTRGLLLFSSYNSHFYGITCADEAKAYLADPVLGGRLRAIAQAFLNTSQSPFEVFGRIDTLKVRSCMTLFDFISPNDLFGQVLDAKYDGAKDLDSLALLQNPHHKPAEPRKRLFNPNA